MSDEEDFALLLLAPSGHMDGERAFAFRSDLEQLAQEPFNHENVLAFIGQYKEEYGECYMDNLLRAPDLMKVTMG